ncbi:hypothetical protein V6N13_057429 [Hibiscus sabdariffa]
MGLALVGMAEDRSKATLPLTIPHRVFKSSAKDSTRRSAEITLQGGTYDLSDARATPTTHALGGHRPLLRVGNRATGACVSSSPDSDLEAFSHNPAHGSFAPLAIQPSAMTNCANQRKSRHRRIKKQRRYERLAATSQLSLCRIPLVRTSSESTVHRPGKAPKGAVPSPSPGRHAATHSRRGSSSSSAPVADGFETGTPVPSPQSQSFSRGYGSILPTSLPYIVPSTRGCSPWRLDAVMSTIGRRRRSVLRIFKCRRGCTGHHATCGALPATGPYLRLSRFQDLHRRPLRPGSRPGFYGTAAPSYSSGLGPCPDDRPDGEPAGRRPEHAGAEARRDGTCWVPRSRRRRLHGRIKGPGLGRHHDPRWSTPRADQRTGSRRSTSDRGASLAPIRFPPDNFKHSLTLFSKSFSSFPRGTCSLSVSRPYLALDGIYRPIRAAFPNNPPRRQRLVVRQGPGTTGLSPSPAPLSRGLGPGPSLRTLL